MALIMDDADRKTPMTKSMKVVRVSKQECLAWIMLKHYSHRMPIFWKGFGLIVDDLLVGVCVYGQPSAPIQSYAFNSRDFDLYELSRLVVDCPNQKNAASFLIANSLKKLKTPCAVVSYADSAFGHVGIVYQASNFFYTGLVTGHGVSVVIDGRTKHSASLMSKGVGSPVAYAKKHNLKIQPNSAKHRYFAFVGSRQEKQNMLSKLNYPIVLAYPKAEKTMYDAGPSLVVNAANKGHYRTSMI